jgi:hypothetical protein
MPPSFVGPDGRRQWIKPTVSLLSELAVCCRRDGDFSLFGAWGAPPQTSVVTAGRHPRTRCLAHQMAGQAHIVERLSISRRLVVLMRPM